MDLYQVVVIKGEAKTPLTNPKPLLDAQSSLGRIKVNMDFADGNRLVLVNAATGEEYKDSTPPNTMTITT